MASVPEVGKEYLFFDDGKTSLSRIYKAKVLRVIPYNEEIFVDAWNYDTQSLIPTNIKDIHNTEIKDCDWLYTPETDYFIECSIPKYDEHNIWFVRTKDNRWFSLDIQSCWQGGCLDVDGLVKETRDGTPITEIIDEL